MTVGNAIYGLLTSYAHWTPVPSGLNSEVKLMKKPTR